MGRPREHDERTREDLRAAAELLVAEGGPDALSVRAVAGEAGTTTRAVYSIFGSKDGLVAALAQTAFELLYDNIDRLPETDDPVADLVAVGTKVVRGLVREHPALYRIAFQRIAGLQPEPGLVAARERAWVQLQGRVQRVKDAGLLGRKAVPAAAGTRAERDVGRPRQCRTPRRRAAHHAEERGGTGLERGAHHRPPRLPRLNSPAETNK
jgi:AcrR family transcriptional regulator